MPLPQPPCDVGPAATGQSDGSSGTFSELSIVSLNMHGFNQGSHTVRDLANNVKPDVVLLQEHWLTPANLYKLHENFPQYDCFCSSAMRSCVETGVLYGRPYGGVAVLVNKKLQHCTEILCCAERFVVVSIGNVLIINVYLPSVGTVNRDCIIEDVLCEISDWIDKGKSAHYSRQSQLLQKCLKSVELVLLCMFQTNLLMGNCSWLTSGYKTWGFWVGAILE